MIHKTHYILHLESHQFLSSDLEECVIKRHMNSDFQLGNFLNVIAPRTLSFRVNVKL